MREPQTFVLFVLGISVCILDARSGKNKNACLMCALRRKSADALELAMLEQTCSSCASLFSYAPSLRHSGISDISFLGAPCIRSPPFTLGILPAPLSILGLQALIFWGKLSPTSTPFDILGLRAWVFQSRLLNPLPWALLSPAINFLGQAVATANAAAACISY